METDWQIVARSGSLGHRPQKIAKFGYDAPKIRKP
jgi:hypothetical protein